MCHESACHSNISKISQIRIFKANPGATFFFFYNSNHFVTGPTYQPRMVAAEVWAPAEGGSGDPRPGPAAPRAPPAAPERAEPGQKESCPLWVLQKHRCSTEGAEAGLGCPSRAPGRLPAPAGRGQLRRRRQQRQLRTAPGTTLPAPLPAAHPAPCSCRTQGSMESDGKNNNVLAVTLSCCLGFLISRFHSAAFHPPTPIYR